MPGKLERVCSLLIRITAIPFLLCSLSGPASAQSYPNKPIKIIVPFVPGGGSDTVARVMAKGLTEEFGQPVVIDNKGGANTIIGTEAVAKAEPDGYTLLLCTTSFTTNPSLYKLPFDTLNDFTPVTMHLGASLILVVNPDIPVKNVPELIALAKQQPGKLTFASYGAGSPGHLAGELFKKLANVDMLHIPYKGSAPSLADVVAGRASMSFAVLQPALPLIQSGRLRPLGFVMAERGSQLPEVPTIGETLPGFLITGFNGICAPKGIPEDRLQKLNAAIAKVMTAPQVRDQMIKSGADVLAKPLGPKEFGEFVRADVERWRKIATDANVSIN